MQDPVNSVYANMAGANDSAMNFLNGTMSKFLSSGTKGFGNMKKISDEILKNFKEVWKIYQQMGIVSGSTGGGKLGLGSFTRGEKVAMGAMVAGAALMDMTPNTAAAVTQRLSANTMVGLTGMGPNRLINAANRGLGLGATSVGAPTQTAMALMYQGGMSIANPYVRNQLFPQIGGTSAFSGMSNQDVAAALSQVNSMNFLRTGTRVRNAKGDLLPVNQMVNNLYQSMYGSRKITREQAAMSLNPYTAAYRTISQVSGGNEQLRTMLTAGVQFRAIAGRNLTAEDLKDPNKVFDILGLPKNDPQRAGLKKIFADNKLLEQSQKGLVQGYTDSLNASASLTEGFSNIAGVLGPVYEGLMRLKGILQTFPNTGGVAGTLSSVGSTAAGMALYSRFAGGGMGAGAAAGATAIGAKASFLGSGLAAAAPGARGLALRSAVKTGLGVGAQGLGRFIPGIGFVLSGYGGFKDQRSGRGIFGGLMSAVGTGAAGGAIAGSFAGGVGALPGAIAGALVSGTGYLAGRGLSAMMGGESGGIGGDTDRSTGEGKLALQSPVPAGTRISSKYGPREKAAADAAKKGKKISSFHKGLDYAVPIGTRVSAAGNGVVTETGNHRDYGLYIIISHGSKSTLYGHLSKISVSRGQKVSAGDAIGLSGDTGQGVTGPHLHFEVRNNGGVGAQGRKNPESFLTKAFKLGKDIITSGINLVKRTVNKVFGTNFKYNDVLSDATKWDFTGSSSLSQQLSSQSIGETIANAINSGSPLGYSDFGGATGRFKTKVTADGRPVTASGRVNGTENLVSGDSGTMVGGGRAGLMKMLYKIGFRGKGLETAFAVALAESGGRSNATNKTKDYGLFQINMGRGVLKERLEKDWRDPTSGKTFKLGGIRDLFDPITNAKVAYHMTNGGKDWSSWVTYNTGSFVKYLDDAKRAATKAKIPSYDVGTDRVPEDQIALVHKDEMIVPENLANQIRNRTTPTGGNTNITVKMDVNIARASVAEAEYMFQTFKDKLEKELNNKNIGVL
jgi:hypothetical protein